MSTYLCKYWDLVDTYDTKLVILQILIFLGLWKQNYRSHSDFWTLQILPTLPNITRPCIRIVYFIYITYLVKLYLVLSVLLQFPDVTHCQTTCWKIEPHGWRILTNFSTTFSTSTKNTFITPPSDASLSHPKLGLRLQKKDVGVEGYTKENEQRQRAREHEREHEVKGWAHGKARRWEHKRKSILLRLAETLGTPYERKTTYIC